MLSWIWKAPKSDTNQPKPMRAERSDISGSEYQAVVAYPRNAERNGIISVGRSNSVTYAARDKKTGVELVCSAPVGSQHAAKVLELCNHIYSSGARDSKPSQRMITTKPRLTIEKRHTEDDTNRANDSDEEDDEELEITSRSPRTAAASQKTSSVRSAQLETQHYAAKDLASRRAYESARHAPEAPPSSSPSGYSRHCITPSAGSTSDVSDGGRGSTAVANQSTSRIPASLRSRHQPEPPQQLLLHQGFKHDSGTQTTYRVHSQKGELFVSAPNGSGEAQLFDDVASRASRRDHNARIESGKKGVGVKRLQF